MKKTIFYLLFITAISVFSQTELKESFQEVTQGKTPKDWVVLGKDLNVGTFDSGGAFQDLNESDPSKFKKFLNLTSNNYDNKDSNLSNWIITSKVSVEAGKTYQYSFYVAETGNNKSRFKVAYGSSQEASSQVNTLKDYSKTSYTPKSDPSTGYYVWEKMEGVITATKTENIYLGFQVFVPVASQSGTQEGVVSFDEVIFRELPKCATPSEVKVSSITDAGATISWAKGFTSVENYKVKVVKNGEDVNSATAVFEKTTSNLEVSVVGLTSVSAYDVYVKSNCGANGESEWSGVKSFKTTCSAVFESLYQDFEGGRKIVDFCWSTIELPVTQYPLISISYLKKLFLSGGGRKDESQELMLVSPKLSTLNSGYRLRFKIKTDSNCQQGDCEKRKIEIGTITNPSDRTTYTKFTEVTVKTEEKEQAVSFKNYTGTDTYIVFRRKLESETDGGFDVVLDDIYWEEIPKVAPQCAEVTYPNAKFKAPAENLTVKWNKNIDAKSYNVFVGKTEGASDVVAPVSVTGLSYKLTKKLAYDTKYYVTVTSVNDFGESTNIKSTMFTTTINPNFGGGDENSIAGGYYFANSISEASEKPKYEWIDPIANNHKVVDTWTGGDDFSGKYFSVKDSQFNFPFYGKEYAGGKIHLSSNGAIYFREEVNTNNQYELYQPSETYQGIKLPLESFRTNKNMISVAHRKYDLSNTNFKVYYHLEAEKCVFTWYKAYNSSSDTNAKKEYISFQAILQKDGLIKIQYNDSLSNLDEIGDTNSNESLLKNIQVALISEDGSKGIVYRSEGYDVQVNQTTSVKTLGSWGPLFGSPLAVVFATDKESLSTNSYTTNSYNLKLFPNPVNDVLNLVSSNTEILKVEIFNLVGQRVLNTHKTQNINVANLNNGVYLVRATTNNGQKVIKFIKQ